MRWTFGEEPLPQTVALAAALRRIAGLAVALEAEHADIDALIATLAAAEQRLQMLVPPEPVPRVGANATAAGRVYLDHSRDVGAFNPCFPEYEIVVAGEVASGTVMFPVAYEGPPGLVHGGFLAVFFDSVIQHHSCDVGVAGKTTSLSLRYRRPTPLRTRLRFDITRAIEGQRINSAARLFADDDLLCSAEMGAVAGDRTALPEVSPRRSSS